MKTNLLSIQNRLLVILTLLLGVGLSIPSLCAQTFANQPTLVESPTSLRVIITPVSNSAAVRIRFENEGRGFVQLQIRDKKGRVLLDESQPKRTYVGQFDLASLPAGLYTIELRTRDARHTEMIRIESPTPGRVALLAEPQAKEPLLTARQ